MASFTCWTGTPGFKNRRTFDSTSKARDFLVAAVRSVNGIDATTKDVTCLEIRQHIAFERPAGWQREWAVKHEALGTIVFGFERLS